MSSPSETVKQAVEGIAVWLGTTPNPGEAVVRQAIVLRLLQASGFDIWNPEEVIPEETDKGGFRPDLRIVAESNQFVLELKGMNVGLHVRDYQQVAAYAGSKGIRWALLTDGRSWLVIDEHLKGSYSERIVIKVELSVTDIDSFSHDIECLMSRSIWSEGIFEDKVKEVQILQNERRNFASVQKEKRPIVESIKIEYGIDTFFNASAVAAKMGLITEEEQQILNQSIEKPFVISSDRNGEDIIDIDKNASNNTIEINGLINFTYNSGDAEARATYDLQSEKWLVRSGSIASSTLKTSIKRVEDSRLRLIEEGILEKLDDGRFMFTQDVIYDTPSGAACDLTGAIRNGWDVWIDELGRTAQFHRLKSKLPRAKRKPSKD